MTMRTTTTTARQPRESSIRADIRRRCLKARVEAMARRNSGRLPTHAEVIHASAGWGDQFANASRHILRRDLLALERAKAIPRLPRTPPMAGEAWRERIEGERRMAAFEGASQRTPLTINNHRARNTSRLPPGVPEGYAKRAAKRPNRWGSEDEIVYRHWRASIPEVTARLLFLDVPGAAAGGAGGGVGG